jgi:hypothetical protein
VTNTDVGVGTGAEPLGEVVPDRELDVGLTRLERLDVGVDGDELDSLEPGVDHAADRVRAAAAGADDLDDRQVGGLDHDPSLSLAFRSRLKEGLSVFALHSPESADDGT